jgi:hypothetical protein
MFGEEVGAQAEGLAMQFMEKLTKQWESEHGAVEDDGLSRLKELLNNVKEKMEGIGDVTQNGHAPGNNIMTSEGALDELMADLQDKYDELAPNITKYKDEAGADNLYNELAKVAKEHGPNALAEFKRMCNGARNSAHMEYDTNPGHFKNWFFFLPMAKDEQMENGPNKADIPAYLRKQSGDKNWNVTQKDMDKDAEKNISSKQGFAALKKRTGIDEEMTDILKLSGLAK